MNFENLVQSGIDYFSAYPVAGMAILSVVGVAAYFGRKHLLKGFFAGVILVAIVYLGMFLYDLTSTGIVNKEKFVGDPNQTLDKLQRR